MMIASDPGAVVVVVVVIIIAIIMKFPPQDTTLLVKPPARPDVSKTRLGVPFSTKEERRWNWRATSALSCS